MKEWNKNTTPIRLLSGNRKRILIGKISLHCQRYKADKYRPSDHSLTKEKGRHEEIMVCGHWMIGEIETEMHLFLHRDKYCMCSKVISALTYSANLSQMSLLWKSRRNVASLGAASLKRCNPLLSPPNHLNPFRFCCYNPLCPPQAFSCQCTGRLDLVRLARLRSTPGAVLGYFRASPLFPRHFSSLCRHI